MKDGISFIMSVRKQSLIYMTSSLVQFCKTVMMICEVQLYRIEPVSCGKKYC